MSDPLRIGIAGLGTVGTGVLDAIARHGELLAVRCGRSLEVTAVSARTRSKTRGVHDVSRFTWYD
ncbi:MAG: homoserine dehydrogenase, partial [Anderseniella sp.]|nr:homoserine dehydrogenase [Anderseniella sp.]